jgi:hypothetical protein
MGRQWLSCWWTGRTGCSLSQPFKRAGLVAHHFPDVCDSYAISTEEDLGHWVGGQDGLGIRCSRTSMVCSMDFNFCCALWLLHMVHREKNLDVIGRIVVAMNSSCPRSLVVHTSVLRPNNQRKTAAGLRGLLYLSSTIHANLMNSIAMRPVNVLIVCNPHGQAWVYRFRI